MSWCLSSGLVCAVLGRAVIGDIGAHRDGHSTLSIDAGTLRLNRGNHLDKQTEDDLQEATALLRREDERGTLPDEVWINPENPLGGPTTQPTRAPFPTVNPVTKFNPLGQGIPHFNSRFANTNGEWEAVRDEQDPGRISYRKFEPYKNTSGKEVYHGETPGEALTAPDGSALGPFNTVASDANGIHNHTERTYSNPADPVTDSSLGEGARNNTNPMHTAAISQQIAENAAAKLKKLQQMGRTPAPQGPQLLDPAQPLQQVGQALPQGLKPTQWPQRQEVTSKPLQQAQDQVQPSQQMGQTLSQGLYSTQWLQGQEAHPLLQGHPLQEQPQPLQDIPEALPFRLQPNQAPQGQQAPPFQPPQAAQQQLQPLQQMEQTLPQALHPTQLPQGDEAQVLQQAQPWQQQVQPLQQIVRTPPQGFDLTHLTEGQEAQELQQAQPSQQQVQPFHQTGQALSAEQLQTFAQAQLRAQETAPPPSGPDMSKLHWIG